VFFQLTVMLGALPAILAMLVFDRLDAKRPEPRSTLRRITLFGALSVIPCVIVELLLMKVGPAQGTYAGALFKGFIVAAAVEELGKVVVLRFFAWNRPEFEERMDGITYATRAGLGFALVENVGYLLGQKGLGALAIVAVLRAVLAVPGHAIFAGVMGYFATKRRFDGTGPGIVGGYVLAVLLHGAYDAAIFAALVAHANKDTGLAVLLLPVPLLIVLVGAVVLGKMVRAAVTADDRAGLAALPPPQARY
jgi:protease PrsW